jgi:hypothetical protein
VRRSQLVPLAWRSSNRTFARRSLAAVKRRSITLLSWPSLTRIARHQRRRCEAEDLPERKIPRHDGEYGADGLERDEALCSRCPPRARARGSSPRCRRSSRMRSRISRLRQSPAGSACPSLRSSAAHRRPCCCAARGPPPSLGARAWRSRRAAIRGTPRRPSRWRRLSRPRMSPRNGCLRGPWPG